MGAVVLAVDVAMRAASAGIVSAQLRVATEIGAGAMTGALACLLLHRKRLVAFVDVV